MNREDIKEAIKIRKDRNNKLKYPCDVSVEQLSGMKPDTEWYIEQLISDAGNGDSSYNLTTYDTNINRIVMIDELSYSYKVEDEEDIINLIEEFDEIYNAYMEKSRKMFLAYMNYKDEDNKGKN